MSADTAKTLQRNRKFLTILLLSVILFLWSSTIVEAKALDTIKTGWSKMRPFAFSGAFWVNAIVIFGALFLLYSLLLANKIGSDQTTATMMYIVIGIVAIVIATKFVAGGVPQAIWSSDTFWKFAQFLIGPKEELRDCGETAHSFWKSLLGINPNPPCCGAGAYKPIIRGAEVCRQAILRTNENGSGLPAFILASIMFYLLFMVYGDKLGFNKMGGDASKWMPIILALMIGALLANERITKNNLIIIGGWVAVILIGSSLSKSLTGENDPKGAKKGFGFGLAFAFVQVIANMLGTSLFGGTVAANEIGAAMIIKNIFIGMAIGFVYSIAKGEGVLGRVIEDFKKKKAEDVERLLTDKKYGHAAMRMIPGLGWFWRLKDEEKKKKKTAEELSKQLNSVTKLYGQALRARADPATLARLQKQIETLQARLMEEIEQEQVELQKTQKVVAAEPSPADSEEDVPRG